MAARRGGLVLLRAVAVVVRTCAGMSGGRVSSSGATHRRAVAVLVGGLLAVGCAPPEGGFATRSIPIVGGTIDATTDAVMALYRTADSRMCSQATIAR